MSEYKKNQLDSLNETMKKAYKKIKEIDMDDLSITKSVEINNKNNTEDGYTQELYMKNNYNYNFHNIETDKKKINLKLSNNSKRLVDTIDNINIMMNKDFKELDEVINNIEKDLKSI
jgi:hypothetical protein